MRSQLFPRSRFPLFALIAAAVPLCASAQYVRVTDEAHALTSAAFGANGQIDYNSGIGLTVNADPAGLVILNSNQSNLGAYSVTATAELPAGTFIQPYYAYSRSSASLYDGTMHAYSTGLNSGGGFANAYFGDGITFHNSTGAVAAINVVWQIDGSVSVDPDGTVGALARFHMGRTSYDTTGLATDNTFDGGAYEYFADNYGANSFSNVDWTGATITQWGSPLGGVATGLLHLVPGDTHFVIDGLLHVSSGRSTADFSDTSSVNFVLPDGVTFDSDSGVFLSALNQPPPPTGAVPEPSTYGLIGALSLCGLVVLRRRRTAKL